MIGEPGELVVTEPMPSMPVSFWQDDDGSRYRAAYFDKYPGVWCHGDWITITDRGSVLVHGRSDATLNRNGVRMGSAEIYDAVETMPQVQDCLVVGVELDDGGYWMPLFVALVDGQELDDQLRAGITAAIREHASPATFPMRSSPCPVFRAPRPVNVWRFPSNASCRAPTRSRRWRPPPSTARKHFRPSPDTSARDRIPAEHRERLAVGQDAAAALRQRSHRSPQR